MTSARAMLARVQRLERLRQAPVSPIELAYGSMDAFADATMAEVEAGKLDSVDMPIVLQCLRNWHRDGVWAGWEMNRNGVWESR